MSPLRNNPRPNWRWLLVALALASLTLLLATASGGERENWSSATSRTTETPSDGKTPEATTTPEYSDGNGTTAADSAFDGIPVPTGASETTSGSSSGSIPGLMASLIPGLDGLDPKGFSSAESIKYKGYELEGSPTDVLKFYQQRLKDWNEVTALDGEEFSIGFWTRDEGKAAVWIMADRYNGVADLMVILGSTD